MGVTNIMSNAAATILFMVSVLALGKFGKRFLEAESSREATPANSIGDDAEHIGKGSGVAIQFGNPSPSLTSTIIVLVVLVAIVLATLVTPKAGDASPTMAEQFAPFIFLYHTRWVR